MAAGALGKTYQNGEIIVSQGEPGDCMYVIQEGQAKVLQKKQDREVCLAVLREGDFFGEMAIFEHEVRSATVRALGEARVLTIDKKTLLSRLSEDPSMAFRLLQKMSYRIRTLNDPITRMKAADRRNWDTRPDSFDGKKRPSSG